MASVFWITEFGREQLPEFVKGESVRRRRISFADLQRIETSARDLLGVWRTVGEGKLSRLPQVILGERAALEDLVAWAATYVPGLSPLSSLIRLMTPWAFHAFRNRVPVTDWEDLAGAAVGLMYGEVMSYANTSRDVKAIDIDMCRSTLSYVLMRDIALGGNEDDVAAIAKDWITLRASAGLYTRKGSCDLVVDIAKEWSRSQRDMPRFGRHSWPIFQPDADLTDQLATFVEYSGKYGDVANYLHATELTAEQRVRIFDRVATALVDDSTRDSRERGMMLAVLAFWCRRGLLNQWAILQPFQARLPECAIWLGAIQVREPMADTLFVGRAVGWKLAMELFGEVDLFRTPDEEISSFELCVGQPERQWNAIVAGISGARIKVGMAPGVNTYLKVGPRDGALQRELPMQGSYERQRKENLGGRDHLAQLQKSLEMTLKEIKRYLKKQG